MRVAVVSTYPPRACGIGTFAADLREALLGAARNIAVDVVAMSRDEDRRYASEVVARVRQDVRGDYAGAAAVLTRRGTDVVVIEHEYGIFGGPAGSWVLTMAEELEQPLVVTLHTVLSSPSVRQAETLRALCARATLVTVFTETARRMVSEAQLVPPERIRVVPHGGPSRLLPGDRDSEEIKARLRVPRTDAAGPRPALENVAGRTVLATFGLISANKGIEMAIEAMPAIVAKHPEALYLVAGRTHPEVARVEGERYRLSLERRVRDLGLTGCVHFIDRFLDVGDLATLLAATDLYVTPYRSREQIVSGALTFAIVAGCPVVSTPYYYAEDLLTDGAGVLVPFDDPVALAEEVIGLLDDPAALRAAREAATALGRTMTWPAVGEQLRAVLGEAVELGPVTAARPRPASSPAVRPDHLLTLVDDVGIVQHADGVVPHRASGYCVDDVARLALVCIGLRRSGRGTTYDRLLALSLGFLRHAWDAKSGGMHNFMSYDRRWLDGPHVGDHLGRAVWALGTVLAAEPPLSVHEPTGLLLAEMLPALDRLAAPRSIAYTILGLSAPRPDVLGDAGLTVLRNLAGRLDRQFQAECTQSWPWFELELTYDNARLPQALLAAGRMIEDDAMIGRGLDGLEWYARLCGLESPYVRLVGHRGLRPGEPVSESGDEQPLDATALAAAEVEAMGITGDEEHGRRAVKAFEWFLGRNRLGLSLYDFATGGCRDGLGEAAVNINQGAESTLAYLQAVLLLDEAGLQTTLPRQ
ncbi:MAG: glycosyltransferase [Mycobacteriales bacterium]